MGALLHDIAIPLYWVISAVLVAWHWVFSFLPSDGWAWALSVVGLTVTIRAALIPIFVKQIKAMRAMQLIQPQVRELQKKHGHDRERLAQEQMKLFKESGTNPFASCLPLLLQMPIFFSLFALLRHAVNGQAYGFLTHSAHNTANPSWSLADAFGHAQWLGASLGSSLTKTQGSHSVMVIAPVLVIMMIATQFLTQRQIMSKNMPPEALTGPYAQQQKIMLYVLPFIFAISSFAFPIGLMLYWTTSNLWTMAQQYVIIKASPTPGSPAAIAKAKREREKALKHGVPATEPGVEGASFNEAPRPAQRVQPKRQTKAQRQQNKGQ